MPFPSMDTMSDSLQALEIPELEHRISKTGKIKSKEKNFDLNSYISELKSKDAPKGKNKDFGLNGYLQNLGPKSINQNKHEKIKSSKKQEDDLEFEDLDIDSLDIPINFDKNFDFPDKIGSFDGLKESKNSKKEKHGKGKKSKKDKISGKKAKETDFDADIDNFLENEVSFQKETPHYAAIEQDFQNLSESRKEIEQAVNKAGKVSFFDGIFKKKEKIAKSYFVLDNSLPDAEKMNRLIEESRVSLGKFNLEDAKKYYMQAMNIYNNLSAKDKELFYEELTQLYRERKSAESIGKRIS